MVVGDNFRTIGWLECHTVYSVKLKRICPCGKVKQADLPHLVLEFTGESKTTVIYPSHFSRRSGKNGRSLFSDENMTPVIDQAVESVT